MQIPTTLKHKPVIVAEDYGNVDGRYAHNTDAKGVSLGLAQMSSSPGKTHDFHASTRCIYTNAFRSGIGR